jgi:hypothetical protein
VSDSDYYARVKYNKPVIGKVIYMDKYLQLFKHEIHIATLIFLVSMYLTRIMLLLRLKPVNELGRPDGYRLQAITDSMFVTARPWTMQRNVWRFLAYFNFIVFHLGALTVIGLSFILSYEKDFIRSDYNTGILKLIVAAAVISGLLRLGRRIINPVLKSVSTADDYLALIMVIVYFLITMAVLSDHGHIDSRALLLFFVITAFFHLYVPFSKIMHYLYYPFARYYLGKTIGHRGIKRKRIHVKRIMEEQG